MLDFALRQRIHFVYTFQPSHDTKVDSGHNHVWADELTAEKESARRSRRAANRLKESWTS